MAIDAAEVVVSPGTATVARRALSPAAIGGRPVVESALARAARGLLRTVALGGALLALLHAAVPVHEFAPPTPFHGPEWTSPYRASPPVWQRVSLHAHPDREWWGALDDTSERAILDEYDRLGFAAVAITDYMARRSPTPGAATLLHGYEHGFGWRKWHQLCFGGDAVEWLDYPLHQGIDEKQHVLDRLAARHDFVVLAHPALLDAYSLADLRALHAYDAIEVLSPYADSVAHWDAALGAGRRVGAIATDDLHGLSRRRDHTRYSTYVDADDRSPEALFAALRAGRMTCAVTRVEPPPFQMTRHAIRAGRLEVAFTARVDRIDFFGRNGRLLQRAGPGTHASLELPADEPYIRVEAATRKMRLLANPAVRTGGGVSPIVAATVQPIATFTRAAALLLAAALLGWFAWRGTLWPRAFDCA